jgi:hypothetical protein
VSICVYLWLNESVTGKDDRHRSTQIYTDQMLEAPDENPSFPHKDITEKIIGAAFEVYTHLESKVEFKRLVF